MTDRTFVQVAPYPHDLRWVVEHASYRKHQGWSIELIDDADRDRDDDAQVIGHGLTLRISTLGYDSYNISDKYYGVHHNFIVPAATYCRADWQRWVFDQIAKVELHECMEHFLVDGQRPFPPTHGKGRDPYVVRDVMTREELSTRWNEHYAGRPQ